MELEIDKSIINVSVAQSFHQLSLVQAGYKEKVSCLN